MPARVSKIIVGCLKEIKENENRVALTPVGVKQLTKSGHAVLIQKNAGVASGFSDAEYKKAGATIVSSAKNICKRAKLVVKIKEPINWEWNYFQKGQIIFTYFHFASNKQLTTAMRDSGASCIAYETVEREGKTVLLAPMSEVAGKMSVLMGAYYLARFNGGSGILASGVTGVAPATVVIVGGGTVGRAAAKVALGLGAKTIIAGHSVPTIKRLKENFPAAEIISSNSRSLSAALARADVAVGAVYVFGERAPKLINREMIMRMKKGSVFVDVAIDQGGISTTSHPTTHSNPTYTVNGVIHYCVTNMPGAFPKTSTLALTNATLPYVLKLAKSGLAALKKDSGFAKGLNIHNYLVTNRGVAKAHNLKYAPAEEALL